MNRLSIICVASSICLSTAIVDGVKAKGTFRLLETNETAADRETVIREMLAGEYNYPVRVIAFNTAEGCSRDVTLEFADEVARRFAEHYEVSDSILQFVQARH